MGTVAKDSGGGDFKLVPAGAHVAICDQVVDLGIQPGGMYDPKQKVYLRWQIPGERVKWTKDGQEHEGPAIIGRTFTLSLSEKGYLRPILESWRGRPFTPAELKGFDVKNVLGVPCMVQVTHETATSGKTYANVVAVMSMPKGVAKPELNGEALHYSTDHPAQSVFDKLSPWIREKINARLSPEDAIHKMAESETDDPGYDKADDEVPF